VVAAAFCIAALLAAVIAMAVLPASLVLPLLIAIGFFTGSATPSRDLLVRQAATARSGRAAYGRIYGFVYSGLDIGFALAPLVFGGLMDRGRFAPVLFGVALLQGLAILSAWRVGRGLARCCMNA